MRRVTSAIVLALAALELLLILDWLTDGAVRRRIEQERLRLERRSVTVGDEVAPSEVALVLDDARRITKEASSS